MLFAVPEISDREERAIKRIEQLRHDLRWQTAEPRRWFGSLRRLSFARAMRGSNSIEGYVASLEDAVAAAEGDEPLGASDETRLALEGYRQAMTLILQLAHDPTFTYHELLVRNLQFMMTSYDLRKNPGLWRRGAVFVRRDDTGEVVYEGPPADLVPSLMAELMEALNREDDCPVLVRGAMAHLNLVMIHPFSDGNGRMARALQTLVLAREGILAPEFASIEEYLGRNTPAYYQVLADVGGGHWQPHRDAKQWIEFSLFAHYRQARTLLIRVKEAEELWDQLELIADRHGLPLRVVPALYDASLGLRVRNSSYRAAQPEEARISDQVASRDLKQMVRAGLLTAHGQARGRSYTRTEPLKQLHDTVREGRPDLEDEDPFA